MPMPPDVKPQSKLTPAQSPSLLWRILVLACLAGSISAMVLGLILFKKISHYDGISDLVVRLGVIEKKLIAIELKLKDLGNQSADLENRLFPAAVEISALKEDVKALKAVTSEVKSQVNDFNKNNLYPKPVASSDKLNIVAATQQSDREKIAQVEMTVKIAERRIDFLIQKLDALRELTDAHIKKSTR